MDGLVLPAWDASKPFGLFFTALPLVQSVPVLWYRELRGSCVVWRWGLCELPVG